MNTRTAKSRSAIAAPTGPMSGLSLLEVLITLSIVAILASVGLPIAEVKVARERDTELRYALKAMRKGIDDFRQANAPVIVSPAVGTTAEAAAPGEVTTSVTPVSGLGSALDTADQGVGATLEIAGPGAGATLEMADPGVGVWGVVPGDGVDNDGDGMVDEEIPDGIDNDGDGMVDEDLVPRGYPVSMMDMVRNHKLRKLFTDPSGGKWQYRPSSGPVDLWKNFVGDDFRAQPGDDIYDVRTKSTKRGLDGSRHDTW